ncbi:MAG: hypothetical protein N4A72_02615 [Bacteroidales bacterium]|jgi:hypothetical protein|nr:hypothetical protein [Bacteroidales bacterium]
MKKLDLKVVFVAIFLFSVAITSLKYWEVVSGYLFDTLNSKTLTFVIWVILIITAVIHYQKNKDDDQNLISDKDDLDKPIDYVQFVSTFGAIGTSVQVLSREVFTFFTFPDLCKTASFKGFDILSFVIVIIVLTLYCYGKVKPVLQETYIEKSKIQTKPNTRS